MCEHTEFAQLALAPVIHTVWNPQRKLSLRERGKTSINSSIPLLTHGQGSPPLRVNYRMMNSTSLMAQEIPVRIPRFAHVCFIAQTLFHILAHAALRKTERNFPPLLSGVSHSNVRAWLPDSFQLETGPSAQCHLTLLGAIVRKAVQRNAAPQPTRQWWVVLLGWDASWFLGIRISLKCIFHFR